MNCVCHPIGDGKFTGELKTTHKNGDPYVFYDYKTGEIIGEKVMPCSKKKRKKRTKK